MLSEHQLLEALDVAVYTTDAEGKITFFNSAAARLWGRSPELGELWCGSWRLYTPSGEPLAHGDCPMAVALKEARPVRGVAAVGERPDGVRTPFMPFPTPLFGADGELVGAVNLLVDLTEAQTAGEESGRLAAIVECSDDAIVSKTLQGVVTSWNAGAERIFGHLAEEMIGQPITKIIPPELHGEEQTILARLSRGERIEHYETVRVAKDGRRVDISLTVSPLRDGSGRIIGASKVARDVTERKRAEATQRLLLNELNHRVKNTLASVESIARQTLRRAASPEDFVASFSGRLKALARANALLTRTTFQGAQIGDLIADQLLLGDHSDRRIAWSGPIVTLTPQMALHLALVLHELGVNARKHGALSSPAGAVSISWVVESRDSPTLILNWRESGGPKVTAPTSSGFGATLIRQSLAAYEGEAATTFAEDGVECTLILPLSENEGPAAHAAHHGLAHAEDARSAVAGKRVLVVEDEALIAMVTIDYLQEDGCEPVGPATNVEAALKMINGAAFDAALLDANLGGRPVDAVAAALVRKGVPFAFVTGYGREALPAAFADAPIVEKPFSQQQLHDALERLLSPAGGNGGNVVELKQR